MHPPLKEGGCIACKENPARSSTLPAPAGRTAGRSDLGGWQIGTQIRGSTDARQTDTCTPSPCPSPPPSVPPHRHPGGIVTPKHSCRRSRATEQHEQRGEKERRERKKVRKASRELHGDDRSPLGQPGSPPAVQEKAAQQRRCRGGGKSQALTAAQPLHLLQTHKRRSYSLAAPQSRPLMPPPRVPRKAKAGGVFSYGYGYSG